MNIIFDFDGVIINSHKIKTKAFFLTFKSYGKTIANDSKNFMKKILVNRYINSNSYLKNI